MKARSAVLLSVVSLALLYAASAGAQETLWFQAYSYDVPGEEDYYIQLADAFAQIPGAPLVRITLDKWDHAHEQIAAWFAGGKGPDLIVIPDIWLAEFAPHIEPLDNLVPSGLRADFFEILYDKGIYHGNLLGLVWATSTKALFYRKDLFREASLDPPGTWADQLRAAVALNDPPNVYGIGLPGAREYETDDNFFFYFWAAGGRFFDDDGKCAINSEAGVTALTFYCDTRQQVPRHPARGHVVESKTDPPPLRGR